LQLVVVEQDVLQRSFGGAAMTVAEATLIADAALEHTVRAVLDALLASEIIKSTRGALSAVTMKFHTSLTKTGNGQMWEQSAQPQCADSSRTAALFVTSQLNTGMARMPRQPGVSAVAIFARSRREVTKCCERMQPA
jgi:hypothetical protein